MSGLILVTKIPDLKYTVERTDWSSTEELLYEYNLNSVAYIMVPCNVTR